MPSFSIIILLPEKRAATFLCVKNQIQINKSFSYPTTTTTTVYRGAEEGTGGMIVTAIKLARKFFREKQNVFFVFLLSFGRRHFRIPLFPAPSFQCHIVIAVFYFPAEPLFPSKEKIFNYYGNKKWGSRIIPLS